MSADLKLILSTLGTVSTLILIPIVVLLYKWSMLLQKIAQTIYGENGNNGLKSEVRDLLERVESLERTQGGRRAEDRIR